MSTKKFLLILLVYIPLIIPTDVSAWDHQRKGFILGYGMGPAASRTLSEIRYRTYYRDSIGFCFDAGLGYATSNSFLLHLYLYSYYSVSRAGGLRYGISFYLDEHAPSFFIDAGLVALGFDDQIAEEAIQGFGLDLAAGYEFVRHLSVKFGFMWGGDTSSEDNSGADIFTLKLTINFLGY